jgi:hypothetical protein
VREQKLADFALVRGYRFDVDKRAREFKDVHEFARFRGGGERAKAQDSRRGKGRGTGHPRAMVGEAGTCGGCGRRDLEGDSWRLWLRSGFLPQWNKWCNQGFWVVGPAVGWLHFERGKTSAFWGEIGEVFRPYK